MPDPGRTSRPERDYLTADQLAEALARLVSSGMLSAAQAKAVRREAAAVRASSGAAPERPPWTTVLAEIGGYVGGAFVLGAAAVLLADRWDELSTAVRLVVLDVPAVLLLLAGWYVRRNDRGSASGDEQGARRRVVAVLVTVAAALLGGGTSVIADSLSASDEWAASAGFATALVVTGVGYVLCRGALLQVAAGSALVGAAVSAVAAIAVREDAVSAWVMIAIAVAWAAGAAAGLLREREFAYGSAGLLAFVAGEMLVVAGYPSSGYPVLVVLAVAGMIGFVPSRAFTVLVTGVGTLAVVVPQLVIDLTDGALGAAGALLVVGLSIVGASVLGLRLRRTAPPADPAAPADPAG